MSSILSRLEKPLMTAAGKLGQQPHLNAIRDGVVGALPLVLIGSLFLLIGQLPLPTRAGFDQYLAQPWLDHAPVLTRVGLWLFHRFVYFMTEQWALQLLVAFRMLVGLIALYVAFGVAHGLARRHELDAPSAGLLAAAALLMMNGMQLATAVGAEKVEKYLPMANLGSGGLFMAILIGLLVPEVQRLVRRYKLEIHMPAGVPPAVGRSFSALIPGLLVLVPVWVVVHLLHIDLFAVINAVLTRPVLALSEHGSSAFVVMLVIILIDSVLWLLGVHAVAILAPMAAVWLMNIGYNIDAVAAGKVATQLNTRETLQFFIWSGGSGATIALPFLLLRARSVSLRAIAKVGAVPALFNINEPLIFGVPVMMNLTLAIPFVLAPLTALITTVAATHFGWVPVPSLVVPWTLPGPIGAFLATKGSWQAAALSVVNIALAALIYWPFVRAYDRRMAETEAEAPTS